MKSSSSAVKFIPVFPIVLSAYEMTDHNCSSMDIGQKAQVDQQHRKVV
ncbi:hypothetical protein [Mucilaginibacter paludis]|uniref:Uncharacterized protein n=1 Tax=Mucilaginibacter paludis DSM 18603 TaxID=714943 RepID=H1YAQ4_9SPHI|nr:hypothetical protein [Mucilaginibacter paludis]EHQ29513.1 hypothetical protein Mucpa_5441 [Mucilaginibacter paludis DSM 18603]